MWYDQHLSWRRSLHILSIWSRRIERSGWSKLIQMNLAEPDVKLFMNLSLVCLMKKSLSHEEKFDVWSRPKLSISWLFPYSWENIGSIGKDDSPWILETNQMRKPFWDNQGSSVAAAQNKEFPSSVYRGISSLSYRNINKKVRMVFIVRA